MITVFVPALNEEANLYEAVKSIVDGANWANHLLLDIIICNDGSTDKTTEVIRRLETEFSFVRSIHHTRNLGIGTSLQEAINLAKYDRFTLFAGDNNATPFLIRNLFKNYNRADLVIAYVVNTENRGRFRNLLSVIFSTIFTMTFDIHVKYINGNPIYPTKELRKLKLHSKTYGILAEINAKLLRKGISYYEVEGYINSLAVKSSALRFKNLFEIGWSFLKLIYEVYVSEREVYNHKSHRIGIPSLEQDPPCLTTDASCS